MSNRLPFKTTILDYFMLYKENGTKEWKMFYSGKTRKQVERHFLDNFKPGCQYQFNRRRKVVGQCQIFSEPVYEVAR